jgi:enoyl-CoA hydratase
MVTSVQVRVASQSASRLLLIERLNHNGVDVAVITFNRPRQRNPIDKVTIASLSQLLLKLTTDDGPSAVILTGAGDTFSAGGDLKGYQDLYRDGAAFRDFMETFDEVCHILETCAALTIAMINGTCIAGGLELSLACDLVTMSDTAMIGDGHLRFAQLPGAGGSQRLVRALGVQRAKQWLYTGSLFPASVALEAGLVYRCAPADELRAVTLDIAAETGRLTPLGRRTMKELVNVAQQTSLAEGLRSEREIVHAYATTSHDATEGLLAFAERRPGHYLGR